MHERILVTSALPYANGPIHFGHLAGAYLPADVYVRYKRLCGAEVLYICGTDEHGAPILLNAESAGQSPREFTDHWHQAIKRTFDRCRIEFDNFSRTSRPVHHRTTTTFFQRLNAHGYVLSKTEEQLFCETDKIGLPDRYVYGTCPSCGHRPARGDECPKCGTSYESIDLLEPRCKKCDNPASKRPTLHWYLDLPKLAAELQPWFAEKLPQWRPNVSGEVQKLLKNIRPRAITRDLSWGIDVPLPEAKGKVFYVWFDAPIGYVSSTIEWAEQQGLPPEAWKTWWQDPGTRLVHFIGKDNIAFHALIFPAMLFGQREGWILPDVPANEFLNLEGDKLSTSAGWYVDLGELLDRYPADALRWTLARNAPELKDADFTWKDFQTRVNTELLNVFGNLGARVLKFVEARYGGKIPAAAAPLSEPEQTALAALRAGVEAVGAELERYSLRNASQKLLEVGYAANKLLEDAPPFKTIKTEPARAATTVNVACRLLEGLAVLLSPFVPDTAAALWRQLGLSGGPEERRWSGAAEPADPAGRQVGAVEHLFRRIEDQDVERELAALQARRAAVTGGAKRVESQQTTSGQPAIPAPAEAAPTAKPEISFEAWSSMDIKVARVLAAEVVPKADKLLKLTLDIGTGTPRTVVSGIRAWYEPEKLVGRQVVYLANLAPRKLRGIESQGMVLAANDVGNVAVLLSPEREVPPGAPVS